MEPRPRKQTLDLFRMIFCRKRKHPRNNSGAAIDADHDRIDLPSEGTGVATSDVVRSSPNRDVYEVMSAAHGSAHVNTVRAVKEDSAPSENVDRSTRGQNELPSAGRTGSHADTAQTSAGESITSAGVGKSPAICNEETSATRSGSHVKATANVAGDATASSGGGTEEGAPSTQGKGRFASYLGTGVWIADTVAQLSGAIPPLKLAMDVLKVILENASVS